MAIVSYSGKARNDLIDIWLWLATRANQDVADAIIDRIERRIIQLADHPHLGPARPDIADDARHLVCERWLALYRLAPAGVEIVRIVDGAQDLKHVTF